MKRFVNHLFLTYDVGLMFFLSLFFFGAAVYTRIFHPSYFVSVLALADILYGLAIFAALVAFYFEYLHFREECEKKRHLLEKNEKMEKEVQGWMKTAIDKVGK